MSLTSEQFMREWPVPDPNQMATIRKRVHALASKPMTTSDQNMLINLYRAYSEVVEMVQRDWGENP